MIIYGHDKEVASWVAQRIGATSFDPCTALGVVSGGRLICGVVYSDYHPEHRTIQLSIAADSPMWARKDTIAQLLFYPFGQLRVYKAWVAVKMDNIRSIKTSAHIGFKREGILAHHFGPKQHAVISRMLEPDFWRLYGKHLGVSHGQEFSLGTRRA